MQKVALVNSTTDTLKKSRLTDMTDRAWFSSLLQHTARRGSGSILSTTEPAGGPPNHNPNPNHNVIWITTDI